MLFALLRTILLETHRSPVGFLPQTLSPSAMSSLPASPASASASLPPPRLPSAPAPATSRALAQLKLELQLQVQDRCHPSSRYHALCPTPRVCQPLDHHRVCAHREDENLDTLLDDWSDVCTSGGRGRIELAGATTVSDFDHVGVHQGLFIAWDQRDVSTLTPYPPELGLCTTTGLASWAPGLPGNSALATLRPCHDGPIEGYSGNNKIPLAFIVAMPIGAAALIASCCTWFCCRRARRKQAARAATQVQIVAVGKSDDERTD